MVTEFGSSNQLIETSIAANQFNSMDSITLMAKQLVQQAKDERPDEAINFKRTDHVRTSKKIVKLTAFKEKIANNIGATIKAKNAIRSIKEYLLSAKAQLQIIIGSNSDSDITAAAKVFDEHLNNINTKVDGATQKAESGNLNLIGDTAGPDWKTDDILTQTKVSGGGQLQIKGTFLGVDFQIKDETGFYWRLDNTDNTFYQYTSNEDIKRTGESILNENLQIESYDVSTGVIKYAGSNPLEGTLERAGLKLLASEYYGGFSNDEAVQTAISDIDNALAMVSIKGAPILANASLLEGKIGLIDKHIEVLENEKDSIEEEELKTSRAEALAADMKLQLALVNINLLSQANNGLVENLLNFSKGPAPAPGLLGLAGY